MTDEKTCRTCEYYEPESEISGLCTLHNFGTKDNPRFTLVIENWEACYASQGEKK